MLSLEDVVQIMAIHITELGDTWTIHLDELHKYSKTRVVINADQRYRKHRNFETAVKYGIFRFILNIWDIL